MAASSPRAVIVINKTIVYRDYLLNSGSEGVQVYSGRFGGQNVAVKRIVKGNHDAARFELEVRLLRENPHEHIVKYYDHGSDDSFFYITMEMCTGTLEDLVSGTYKGPPPGDAKTVLHQITEGLSFLHSKMIVHRDLKPRNILISQPESPTSAPKMKLADFGISKQQTREYYYSNTGSYGTVGWAAPELLKETNDHFKLSVDIFSLGCIFGYVLTGHHPFGDTLMRSANIVKNELAWAGKEKLKDRKMKELIKNMIAKKPKKRPSIGDVLKHFLQPALPTVNVTSEPKPPHDETGDSKGAKELMESASSASPRFVRQNTAFFKHPGNIAIPSIRKDSNSLYPTSPAYYSPSPRSPHYLTQYSPSPSKPSSPLPSGASRHQLAQVTPPSQSSLDCFTKALEDSLDELQQAVKPKQTGNAAFQRSGAQYSSCREPSRARNYPAPAIGVTPAVTVSSHVSGSVTFERGTHATSSLRASSAARSQQWTRQPPAPSVNSLVHRFEAGSGSGLPNLGARPAKK